MMQVNDSRGSIWRKWDLHVHSPASFGYKGSYDDLIKTLSGCEAEVIGINDYCTLNGYDEILMKGGLRDKVLFPVIEFRMHNILANRKGTAVQKGVRINFHLVFNNNPDVIRKAKTWLSSLDCYNPQGKNDQLGNISKSDIEKVTVDFDKVIESLEKIDLRREALVWLPYGEYGGIDDVDPDDSFFKLGLIKKADVIGSSTEKQIEFFLWKDTKFKKAEYEKWFKKPIPCIKGSDSHEATYPAGKLKDKDSNPTERYCWIKADPTFGGLRQITVEPEDRVFIGTSPPKLQDIENNKAHYVDSVKIQHKTVGHKPSWFDDEMPLNNGLIAIIGKKGSGKSALADIIALNGKSSVPPDEYSFLIRNKFRKKDLAKDYSSTLSWTDSTAEPMNLNDEVNTLTEVEKVKYLPQHFVETICNEDGVSELFQQEIDKVIFSYVPEPEKLGAANLDELIATKAGVVDQLIADLREKLRGTNFQIVELEKKSRPDYKKKLTNELAQKERELKALVEPKEVKKPTNGGNTAAQTKAKELSENIEAIKESIKKETKELTAVNDKIAALNKVKSSLDLLEKRVEEYIEKLEGSAKEIPLDLKKIVGLTINRDSITAKEKELKIQKDDIEKKLDHENADSKTSLYARRDKYQKELEAITGSLNKEQKAYQEYHKALKEFKEKQAKIIGKEGDKSLSTISSINSEIAYIEKKLEGDLETLYDKRTDLVREIFTQLLEKIEFYKEIYQPLTRFIDQEKELQEKTGNMLDFAVGLSFDKPGFSERFFSFINQQRDGSFQGIDQGKKLLKSILGKFNFDKIDDMLNLLKDIMNHLQTDVTKGTSNRMDVNNQLKADKGEFYDFLYSLEYLTVQYTIMFNGKDLNDNEFSPGEKGALLLIFYLLIDRNRIPLIMDQPEENLDNESVYDLLVPYIKKAKRDRQIFVVTHNPNLAVVCDAEQVICASMNKKSNEIRYIAGSIENPEVNKKISDILEGTLPAFDIRDEKYIRN